MQCPYCSTMNPAQARYCLRCGRLLVNGLVCPTCHTLLPANSRYCFHCGAALVLPGTACPRCGNTIAPGQAFCAVCGAPSSQPASPVTYTPPPAPTIVQPQTTVQPPTVASLVPQGAVDQPAMPVQPAERVKVEPAVHDKDTPGLTKEAGVKMGLLPAPLPLCDMLPSLQRYLTPGLYEPLERRPTPEQLEEVSKHLTRLLRTTKTYLPWPVIASPQPIGEPAGGMYQGVFLFGDVSGFTPLSERLKPLGLAGAERIADVINGLFQYLVGVLFKHGGVLLKFGGDALLGLFMAENDEEMSQAALRAAQTAMDMQAGMGQFSAIEAAGETRALRIKIGISSGPYFAAHIGTKPDPDKGYSGMMAYVTTGHTVNHAEEAEGNATPGEVAMTQSTRDLLSKLPEFSQMEFAECENKGYSKITKAPAAIQTASMYDVQEPPDGEVMRRITYLVQRMDRLSPYLSADLIKRIAGSPGEEVMISPDHRPVTVMFANYQGISELIEAMGEVNPDVITLQLNNYFSHMYKVVEHYEGTLARMDQYAVGDRLVIFFGAPRAHEDDPMRAVFTALEMQRAVRKNFAALQTNEGVFRFRQRIGINTGVLFAGNIGSTKLRQEYTLMGDDINMAARLMSKAEWQKIFISKKTQERVCEQFELKDRGEFKVKGKDILIHTYEVAGPKMKSGEKKSAGLATAHLIGREDVVQTLQKSGQNLLSGRGQILAMVGESGLGKSRLVHEYQAWLADQGQDRANWLEAHALSFSEQVSYWLAAQILRAALHLDPDASEDDTLYLLWELGENLMGKPTAREAVPFLANLMNLELEGEWANWVRELDPKVRQKQTFWAAREFFTAYARHKPTMIAIDDLHFADEASLALLEDLMSVTVNAPLMFCFTFRPHREKGCWRLRDRAANNYPHRFTEIDLKPLSAAQTQELLKQFLPGAVFPDKILQKILDKSAGNPFYVGEVARTMLEAGAVMADESQPGCFKATEKAGQISVPDTLQSAIIARIDRLTEEARMALQMAAVIGRRFQTGILGELTKAEDELGAWLAQLERSDLVQPEDVTPGEYVFPDALVQEVAYDNLLMQRRKEFHYRVGETLEEITARRVAAKIGIAEIQKTSIDDLLATPEGQAAVRQECELLAYHFRFSDHTEKAMRYLEMAGCKAQEEFANETAIQHYTNLLSIMQNKPELWEKRFAILEQRQQIYNMTSNHTARKSDLDAMMELAKAHDDDDRRGNVLNNLADMYQWMGKYENAVPAAEEALEIETRTGDKHGQSRALHTLGVINYYQGNYDKAAPQLEQAIDIRREVIDQEGEAWSTMYLGMIHFFKGNLGEAAKFHQQALAISQSRQDMFQIGIHLTNLARVSQALGEYDQALEKFQQSLEMKIRIGDRIGQSFNLFWMGQNLLYLGRLDESEKNLLASLDIRKQTNDERGQSYSLHGLGQLAMTRGQFGQAEGYFQQAYEIRAKLKLKVETAEELSWLGQACLKLNKLDDASRLSHEAIAMLAGLEDAQEVQQIYLNHYRLLQSCGDPAADEFLHKAYDAMVSQANRIEDPEKRKDYLEKVKVNREISLAIT